MTPNYIMDKMKLLVKKSWDVEIIHSATLYGVVFKYRNESENVPLCEVNYSGKEITIFPAFFDHYRVINDFNPFKAILEQVNGNLIYKGKKWKPIPGMYRDGEIVLNIEDEPGWCSYDGPIKEGGMNMTLHADVINENGTLRITDFEKD